MSVEKRRKRLGFTNRLAVCVLAEDVVITGTVLVFCAACIWRGFDGALPFLTALIGLQQAKSTVVLTAVVGKSKAENVRGGINYQAAANTTPDC